MADFLKLPLIRGTVTVNILQAPLEILSRWKLFRELASQLGRIYTRLYAI